MFFALFLLSSFRVLLDIRTLLLLLRRKKILRCSADYALGSSADYALGSSSAG